LPDGFLRGGVAAALFCNGNSASSGIVARLSNPTEALFRG